jgi:predicted lactoylglutathione lyase
MSKMIFVNLPVSNVARSTAFYEALGFEKNPAFSNEQSSCLVWSEAIYLMVLDKAFYATFTSKQIADAKTQSQALFALSFDSRADVDAITEAAVAAGGRELHEPEDLGFMYSRAFEDPDGHGFGPMWMDPAAAEAGPPQVAATA